MLTIGKMSQASHVSIKTLRYYDSIGLLKPAHTDPQTGYRFYSLDQIEVLNAISRFKRYGFSLAEIRELIEVEDETVLQKLKEQKKVLEKQIETLQQTAADLLILAGHYERKQNYMSLTSQYEISLKETEQKPVLAYRKRMGVGDFGYAFGQLYELAAREGIQPGKLTGSRYYDDDFDADNSDIEVFSVLDDSTGSNGTIGGGLCVSTVHHGGYSSLSDAYSAIVRWMEENGYEATGAPYELYTVNGFQNPDPAAWQTEIFFPARKRNLKAD